MQFGALIWPVPGFVAEQTKWIEEQGFTHAWFSDAPLAGGADTYVCMALAAKVTRKIKLGTYIAPAPLRAIDLEHRIPLYVAASAPKAAALAGEFGDGLITAMAPVPGEIASLLERASAARHQAKRKAETLPYLMEGPICVLRSGETFESPRVLEITQAFVMSGFKWFAAAGGPAEMLPAGARPAYRAYLAYVDGLKVPAEERHLAVWEGCFTPRPDERRFVTPEAIHAMTISGALEEVVERIRALETAGLNHLTVWLPERDVAEYVKDIDGVRARL